MILHFTKRAEIFEYLKKNPTFLAGFVSGEGCFTAYMGIDLKANWGLQPSCEFSITQNSGDLLLLEAINLYFNSVGRVYDKKSGVHVLMIRNLIQLNNEVLPFFIKFPLVGTKSYEYEKFSKLVNLILSKTHVGDDLSNRDIIIEMAYIFKDLNSKIINPKKLARLEIIICWLKGLNSIPSLDNKLELKSNLEVQLRDLRRTNKPFTH
jgi:hypothetical protein